MQTQHTHPQIGCNYLEEQGCPANEHCLRSACTHYLPGFAAWAEANALPGGPLTEAEVCMCGAVWQPVKFYDRAKIKDVIFACERLQRNFKLKSCMVMSKVEWRNAARGPVRVGIIWRFFKYRPPWMGIDDPDDECLNVADVEWMKP